MGHPEAQWDIIKIKTEGVDGTANTLGQVEYGSLRVRGKLKSVGRIERPLGPKSPNMEHGVRIFFGDEANEDSTNQARFYPGVLLRYDEQEELICIPAVKGVFLGEKKENSGFDEWENVYIELVLSSSGEYRNEYRRVGVFEMDSDGPEDPFEDLNVEIITIV